MRKIILLLTILIFANASEEMFLRNEYQKAYKSFKKECMNKNAHSCYRLGQMNELALGTKKSYLYAVKYYETACDLGNLQACTALGKMYSLGLGVDKNISKASDIFYNACKNNIYEACDNYAYLQKTEFGSIKDKELLKACSAGIASSCYELANYVHPDYKTKFYIKACALGDELACEKISNIFVKSNDNLDEIRQFSKTSRSECDKQNYNACKALADVYKHLKDNELAIMFYDKACNLNDSNSCVKLADIYESLKKLDLSFEKFSLACDELNNAYACYKIGEYHKQGLNGIADEKKSNLYYKKSCDFGYLKACKD